VKSPRGKVKRNLYDAFKQIDELFDIRKIPIAMVQNAVQPSRWSDNAQIETLLDEHFPLATTVRGQPGSSKKGAV